MDLSFVENMINSNPMLHELLPEVTIEGDKGLISGLAKGVFAISEDAITAECAMPEIPPFFMQVEAMIPMAKMMITNANQGVEPEWFAQIEDSVHPVEIIGAVIMGDMEHQYCTGALLAFEYKDLVMELVQ